MNIRENEQAVENKDIDKELLEVCKCGKCGRNKDFNRLMRDYILRHSKQVGQGIFEVEALRPFRVDINRGTTTLKPARANGYCVVCMNIKLYKHSVTVVMYRHELIALLGFTGYRYKDGDVVNHKDNGRNDAISNLEILTNRQNIQHGAIINNLYRALGFTGGRPVLKQGLSYFDIPKELLMKHKKDTYSKDLINWYIEHISK